MSLHSELSEETVVDRIDVTEEGYLLVRRATFLLRDGERQPSPRYHRVSYEPGADLAHEDARVQAIAAAAWTDDVVRAFAARKSVALHTLVRLNQETPNDETPSST